MTSTQRRVPGKALLFSEVLTQQIGEKLHFGFLPVGAGELLNELNFAIEADKRDFAAGFGFQVIRNRPVKIRNPII